MPRDPRLYLDDILEAIQQIQIYVEGVDKQTFASDRKTQDAVIRNLEIIGEVAGNLSEAMQKNTPEIDWRKIKALRNILVHEYFGISLPIIWDIVNVKLEPLKVTCHKLLQSTD